MEAHALPLVVPGTLHKDQKKGRTLRGKSGKHLWFQKQGGKVYYATKNNGGEIGESNAKGFIPCAGILRMFELTEETAVAPATAAAAAPTGDTATAAATHAHQVELLTTEGRIVLTFASKDAAGAWMAAVQSEMQQRSLSDPRRKFTIEDVRMPAASLGGGGSDDCSGGAGAVPPSPRSAGGTSGHDDDDDDEEEARMSKIGSFIRGKARRKRSSSDKEKGKDNNNSNSKGKDGLSVEETERPAATIASGTSEGRKRPPLPFSFRSRDARATVVVPPHNREKGESEQGGVQVVSTFSSRNIPIEIMNALAGVNSGGSTLPVPLVSPVRSSSPTGEATGGEGLSTTPPKDGDGKMRARHMTMATDTPKLVHAIAPHSPATMFAQVVKEGSTSKVLFLPGEDLKAGIRNVLVLLRGRAETAREGSLYITNYRLLWRNPSNRNDILSIPFHSIRESEVSANQECLFIECADFRSLEVYCKGPQGKGVQPEKQRLMQYEDQKTLRRELRSHLSHLSLAELFAFQNKERFPLEAELAGWPIYEPRTEAQRWHLSMDQWQLVENTKFKLSPSYPPHIILPSFLNKRSIANALDNYAERRIAALCWKDPNIDTALIFRSATSSKYTLLSDIARVRSHPTIHLFNITFSATEKKGGVAGASDWEGLEVSDETAPVVKEEFLCNEDHLNVINLELPSPASVGLSFARLKKAVSELAFIIPNDRENWIPALKATRWLHNMRRLLEAVAKGVSTLQMREPIVVQSIDGMNCVPQITSLIQLCVDPYYRTFKGFSTLVEKEWISFTHDFGQGRKKPHGKKEAKKSKVRGNMTHIFVQFMDAVWQLWSQCPRSFEFSESYLLFILDSLYSGRFGTFLGDNFYKRHKHKLVHSTVSVWSYLYANRASYTNPLYSEAHSHRHTLGKPITIAPLLAKFWSSYFLQFQCRDTLNHASLIIDATFGPREELGLPSMGSSSFSASSSAPAIQAIRSSSPTLLSPLPSPSPSWASPMTETSDTLLSFTDSPRSSQSPLSLSTASTDEDSSASSASWAAQQTDSSCSQRGSVSALSSQTSSASSSLIVPALNLARKGLHSIPAELSATDDRRFGHMTGLNLSNNILSYFSFLVAHLRQLEVLNLSTNEFREIPELLAQSFVELTRLRELDISHNKIYRLPAQLSLLTNLQRLEASHNRLLYTQQGDEATSERLWGLSGDGGATATRHTLASFDFAPLADSLEYLSISYNSPKAKHAPSGGAAASSRCSASLDLHLFPRSLLALTHLTTLKFHGNNIPYLPPNFFATFKRLQDLDMGDNAITILPSGLGGLQLTSLNINNIELKELMPQEVFQLDGTLRELHAQGLRLVKLPPGFSALTALETLDLSNNVLSAFPESLLTLSNLQCLTLNGNNLTTLPTGIKHLKNLEKLYLKKNELVSLVPEIGFCKALGVLDISDNKIKELPPQLGALPRLRRLIIGKNMPLVSPPINIEAEGEEAVLGFIKQFINGFERCYRYKLMLVGQENVGKSTLLRCLNSQRTQRKPDAQQPNISTDGIDIGEWTIKVTRDNETKEISLTTWDFAGQELYYSTHQFFLSERSLFLLVTDVSKPLEFSRLDFWLESIRSRTKSAQVIIVGTHIDEKICTSEYLEAKEKEIRTKYLARYPNIHALCLISCSNGKNMSALHAKIEEILSSEVHLGEFLPKSYLELERMILQQRKNRAEEGLPPIALWSEYKSWAELCLIENEKELKIATTFLHNLGSLLYFSGDENLADVVILDPQWLTDVMATIITTKHNYLGREGYEGILQHSVLPFIWRPPTFPDDLHGFILYLLNKFEITFTLDDDDDNSNDNQEGEGEALSLLSFLPTSAQVTSSPDQPQAQAQAQTLSASSPLPADHTALLSTGTRSRSPSLATSAPPQLPPATSPTADEPASSAEAAAQPQSQTQTQTVVPTITVDPAVAALKRKSTRELLERLVNKRISRKRRLKGCSLVPALLSTKRPDDLASVWPPRREGDGVLEYGRIYTFDFAPSGFFAKVMVRLLSFRLPQILKYWRNGLLLSSGFEKVFVEFDPTQKVLSVTIRAEDRAHADMGGAAAGQPQNSQVALPPSPSEIDQRDEEKLQQQAKEQKQKKKKKSGKKEKEKEKESEGKSAEPDAKEEKPKKKKKKSRREKPEKSDAKDFSAAGTTASSTAMMMGSSDDVANSDGTVVEAGKETPSFQLLSLLVFSTIDALVRDWFKLGVEITVPCPHCIAGNLPNATTFSFTELQRALLRPENAYIMCKNVGKFGYAQLIRIDRLMPDVAMLHLDDAKIEFSEVTLDEEIGSGGFADLYKGKWRDEVVAIKKFKFTDDETLAPDDVLQALEEFRQEVWIMGGLRHPNIVALRAFCMEPCCIVEELVTGGNLLSFLHSPAELDWTLRLKILKDVAKGCAFLHGTTPPVMHRDLKTPNILLVSTSPDADLVAKVCDFGVSINSSSAALGRKVDCPLWLAPEVMMGKPYTGKADVYSFGVICWESIARKRFFEEISFMSLIEEKVIAGNRPPIPEQCHPEFAELINSCWHQDPNKRPTFAQVVEQLRQIMARYCPEHVDYDRDVMAREEALERQRQERNRQYRLEQNNADREGENENESEERSEEEGGESGEASANTMMVSPVSPKPLRKRGPSINVVQQALACRDTAQATRKAMLDQLRQMSRQRDLPHTFSLALALPEPEQLTAAASPAADAPTAAATPRLADEAAAMKESDASAMMPLTPRGQSGEPAMNDAAPPPSATDDGGATAAAAGTAPEDEAKLKEKEERKRRVEEIRAKMQRQTSSRISVPKGGSNAPLSPRPTNQDQG